MFQRGAQVDRTAVAVLQAAGLVAVVKAVPPGAIHGGGRVNACSQRGGCHGGLESRTRRIQPLGGAVQQRRGGIGGKGRVVRTAGVQVKPRHAGGGQDAAGFHVYDHGGPSAALPPGPGGLGGL